MNCTLVLTRLIKLSLGLVGLRQKLISKKLRSVSTLISRLCVPLLFLNVYVSENLKIASFRLYFYISRMNFSSDEYPFWVFLYLKICQTNSDMHRNSKNATLKSKKPLPQEKKVQLCFKPIHYKCVCLTSDSITRPNRNWSKLACNFKQLGHLFLVIKLLYCQKIIKNRSSLYIFLFKSFI